MAATTGYWIRIGTNGIPVASSMRASKPAEDGNTWIAVPTAALFGITDQASSDWQPVTRWLDGSLMDDSKLWPGWYEKDADGYKARRFANGTIWLNDIGFKNGTDSATDILPLWDKLVAYTPPRMPFDIRFGFGKYYSSGTLNLIDRNWRLSMVGASVIVPGNVVGFIYDTSGPDGVDGAILEVDVTSQGRAEWDGIPWPEDLKKKGIQPYGMAKDRPAGLPYYYELDKGRFVDGNGKAIPAPEKSNKHTDYNYHGIIMKARCEFIPRSSNFSGCGFINWGEDVGMGKNTSGSYIHDGHISQTGSHGYLAVGPDANNCVFARNRLNEIGGVAIYENSFLGGLIYGNMVHYAKLGSWRSDVETNNSVFIANYNEGSPFPGAKFPNSVGFFGGTNMNGIDGGQGWDPQTGWRIPGAGGVTFRDGGILMDQRENDANKRFEITNDKIESSYSDAAKRFTGALHINTSKYDPDALMVYDADTYDEGNKARMGLTGVRVPSLMVGEYHIYPYTPEYVISKGVVLKVGDRFWVGDKEYIVTKGGDKPEWKVK